MTFDERVMTAFGQNLRAARERAGFNAASDFAAALGVHPHRYRHWEHGRRTPDLPMVTRICNLLNVEPNDLLPYAVKKGRSDQGAHRAA